MSTSDMKQAREWADQHRNISDHRLNAGVKAAAEVIQSLPDQWIDADKLRQIIDFQGTSISEEARKDLESLLTPPLLTLADMTPEEREACRGMQVEVAGFLPGAFLIGPDEKFGASRVAYRDGTSFAFNNEKVTPIPELPRLQWPAQEPRNPETPPAETLNNTSSDTPRNPRPEDVPAGEAWLILSNGHEWVGIRDSRDVSNYPWLLSRLDGIKITSSKDLDIALVSRLVPEDKP